MEYTITMKYTITIYLTAMDKDFNHENYQISNLSEKAVHKYFKQLTRQMKKSFAVKLPENEVCIPTSSIYQVVVTHS